MRVTTLLLMGALGCSDDGPVADPYRCVAAGGEGCFELPTDVVAAADVNGVTVLPVLDCGPYEVVTSASPVTFSGHVVDFLNEETFVPDVRIEAFADMTLTSRLFDVTSDADGAWTASANVPNEAFARTTATGKLPMHFMYGRVDINVAVHDMFNFQTATKTQVASAFELVGDRFLPGKSQLAAAAYDCNGNKLVNAVANIAPASGKNGTRLFEPNVRTYYGIEGTVPLLGRRTEIMQTSTSGLIGIANVPPGMHYVQLWGFPDASSLAKGSIGLKLLDEKPLFVADGEAGYLLPLYGRL
jgi:hypothetical protein